MTTITPARRRTRLVAGALAGTALAIGAPLAASAHVAVDPGASTAGAYQPLTFAFSHGCDHSPTTALTIDIPEGVESVAPQIEPGWTITTAGADDGVADQVTFTADEPVETGLRATVTVQVKFADDLDGQTIAFPVLQSCSEGETDWAELAEEGQDPHELDAPAPTVTVAAATSDDAHGHGTDDTATAADDHGAQASADSSSSSALPIALGAGGLLLGAAGLVAGLVALARTRRS